MPSAKYLFSFSSLRLSNGNTAIEWAVAVLVVFPPGGLVPAVLGQETFPRSENNRPVANKIAPKLRATTYERRREVLPAYKWKRPITAAERPAEKCSKRGPAPLRYRSISSHKPITEEYRCAGLGRIALATIRSS